MFMHNGQIGGYQRLRRRLEAMIPDRYYGHRQGTTDSEVLFYLLFGNGLEDDPVAALSATLAEVQAAMAEEGVEEPLRFTAALSDGRSIRSEEHTSELQSLMRISYAVFCLKKKKNKPQTQKKPDR